MNQNKLIRLHRSRILREKKVIDNIDKIIVCLAGIIQDVRIKDAIIDNKRRFPVRAVPVGNVRIQHNQVALLNGGYLAIRVFRHSVKPAALGDICNFHKFMIMQTYSICNAMLLQNDVVFCRKSYGVYSVACVRSHFDFPSGECRINLLKKLELKSLRPILS